MFRDMRRKRQALHTDACEKILGGCTSGVLALLGDEDYPYAVPMSYCYANKRLYFHCAHEGHKLDAVRNSSKCSFCVIEQDDVLPEKFTTLFKSVICFGEIKIIDSRTEKIKALNLLADKYSPDADEKSRDDEILSSVDRAVILVLDVAHMTGKQCVEFLKG